MSTSSNKFALIGQNRDFIGGFSFQDIIKQIPGNALELALNTDIKLSDITFAMHH